MAGEMVRRGGEGGGLRRVGPSGVAKKAAKHAMKHAKHAAKHVAKHAAKRAEKHASKRAAKKSAGRQSGGSGSVALQGTGVAKDLREAFHAMQRAGAVISLLEKETGEDLRRLLHEGVELYRAAAAGKGPAGRRLALAAAALLRATEYLAMAGLYAAREKHLLNVPAPPIEVIERVGAEVTRRLERLRTNPGSFAEHVHLMALELLRRAERADHDVHVAHELTMAAEGLSIAVENWPEA